MVARERTMDQYAAGADRGIRPELAVKRSDWDSLMPWPATLNDAVQGSAGGGQGVDAAGHGGIFDQRRGVVRLDAGVDHQRAAAAPVLVLAKGPEAVDVAGRIAARE